MLFDGLRHVFRPASSGHAAALLFLALAPLQVGAQSLADKVWWSSSHNKMAASVSQAVGTPHAGIPYLTPLPTGSVNLPAGRVLANANAWPDVAVQTRLPQYGPVIDVKARVTPASAAKAIGRYLGKVGPLANAVALVTLASELGFTLKDGPNGPEVTAPPHPSAMVGNEYREGFTGEWSSSIVPACQKAAAELYTSWVQTSTFHEWNGGANCVLRRVNTASGAVDFINHTVNQRPRQGPEPTGTPADIQALEDAIAAKSGWPSSSTIAAALGDAIKATEAVQTETPRASGPASSPGTTTTTTRPDGKVETKSTTNNYTYNTNTVTITQTTTTSVFNPADGTTETTTEESEPDIPPSECELNPKSLGCSTLDTPTGEIPKKTETITYNPASGFGGSGSCPADRSWTSIQTGDTHTASFRPVCDALDLLKPMFIAIALFMGYMIVLPRAD